MILRSLFDLISILDRIHDPDLTLDHFLGILIVNQITILDHFFTIFRGNWRFYLLFPRSLFDPVILIESPFAKKVIGQYYASTVLRIVQKEKNYFKQYVIKQPALQHPKAMQQKTSIILSHFRIVSENLMVFSLEYIVSSSAILLNLCNLNIIKPQ